jgi:hypothetical protein
MSGQSFIPLIVKDQVNKRILNIRNQFKNNLHKKFNSCFFYCKSPLGNRGPDAYDREYVSETRGDRKTIKLFVLNFINWLHVLNHFHLFLCNWIFIQLVSQ